MLEIENRWSLRYLEFGPEAELSVAGAARWFRVVGMSAFIMRELAEDPVVITGAGACAVMGGGVAGLVAAARGGIAGGRWLEVAGRRYAGCPVNLPADSGGKGRRLDPSVRFALEAAAEARSQAGWNAAADAAGRRGVAAGTSRGCQRVWEQARDLMSGGRRARPTMSAATTLAALSGAVAQASGAGGPGLTVSATCASGAAAVAYAAEQLLLGNVDLMLAGGADAVRNGLVFSGMEAAGVLGSHEDPAWACRPFDASRNGLILGEGAGFLVLERASHAASRGAEILGKLDGWAVSMHGAAGKTGISGDGSGLAAAMRRALSLAGMEPGEIGYVNAHGTGTLLNDHAEAAALQSVFGDRAPPVSSTKPVTGHCLGATPVLEAILCLAALEGGWIPPQACCREIDAALRWLDIPLTAGRRLESGSAVMSNSLGFWGYHASLIFSGH